MLLVRSTTILDALEIETGRSLTTVRNRAAARDLLEAAIAQARVAGLDVGLWLESINTLSTDEIKSRNIAVETALSEQRKSAAVASSRRALLSALGDLGYEITEGMATAWSAEGRLVLRSGSCPNYGVEVSGTDRVQMKPVAFESGGVGPDAARDRDAELIWCGDVSRLRKALSTDGGGLHIQRELPVGTVPLKRIAMSTGGDEVRSSAPNFKSKTLR